MDSVCPKGLAREILSDSDHSTKIAPTTLGQHIVPLGVLRMIGNGVGDDLPILDFRFLPAKSDEARCDDHGLEGARLGWPVQRGVPRRVGLARVPSSATYQIFVVRRLREQGRRGVRGMRKREGTNHVRLVQVGSLERQKRKEKQK